jgi:hypothetical protein
LCCHTDSNPQPGSEYFRANVLNHAGDLPNFDYLAEASPQFNSQLQARRRAAETSNPQPGYVTADVSLLSDNRGDAVRPASTEPTDQIHWFNDFTDAFTAGISSNKPIVILFEAKGPNTDAIQQQLLDPIVQNLGSRAAFGVGHVDADQVALTMAKNLDLTRLPTISVFAPNSKQISEMGRLEGYHTADQIAAALDVYINRAAHINDANPTTT